MPDPREAWRLTDAEMRAAFLEWLDAPKEAGTTMKEYARFAADAAAKKALEWAAQQCEERFEPSDALCTREAKHCAAAIRGAL